MIGKRVNFFIRGTETFITGTVTGIAPDDPNRVIVDGDKGFTFRPLAGMCKVLPTPDEWHHPDVLDVAMHEQLKLSYKDKLTEDDIVELKRLNEVLDPLVGHPMWLTFDELIKLDLDACPAWVADLIDDKGWGWQWWADHFGYDLAEHVKARNIGDKPCLTPAAVTYINNMHPFPPGWMPKGRR